MRELVVKDDGQLGRVERAIAALEGRSVCDRMRMQGLLEALYAEQHELQRYTRPRRAHSI